jgi:hypothetical protein
LRNILHAAAGIHRLSGGVQHHLRMFVHATPDSLNRSLRVVRCSNLLPSACSRRETQRLIADGVAPETRAAAEAALIDNQNKGREIGK